MAVLPASGRAQRRQWLLSLAVTGGIFAYLLSRIDIATLLDTARAMTPGYVYGFLVLLLGGVVARATRFWLLLGRTAPLSVLTPIVLVRNLFVDLLPARLGELSYVYLLRQRTGRTTADGMATLLLAILLDLAALAPLLVLAIGTVWTDASFSAADVLVLTLALASLPYLLIRCAGPAANWVADALATGADNAIGRARVAVASLARQTGDAVMSIRARRILPAALAVSVVVRLCKFGSYYCLVLATMTPLGYHADDLGFFRVFLGVASAELAAALPVPGIAGFGAFEAGWTLSFSRLGFSAEDAAISGILVHAVSQVVEYSLGLCALLYVMRPRRLG